MLSSDKRIAVALGATLVMGVAGCSRLKWGPGEGAAPIETESMTTELPVRRPDQDESTVAAPNDAAVAAIEEFLERTRDYAKPAIGASPAERSTARAPVQLAAIEAPRPVFKQVEQPMKPAPRQGGIDPRASDVSTIGVAPPTGMTAESAPRGEPADPNKFNAQHAAFAAMEQRVPAKPQMTNVTPRATPPASKIPAFVPQQQVPKPALPVLQSMTIRSGTTTTPAPTRETSTATPGISNVPVDVAVQPQRATWQVLIDDLVSEPSSKRDVEATWRLGLARLAVGRGDPEKLPADGLVNESRQLFDSLFALASSVRVLVSNPVETGERALSLVDSLRERIAGRSDPVVANVSLCSRVTTFGVFEPMGTEDVVAGKATQTIVYSEIDNLHAVQREDGKFETRLSTRVEVLTAGGQSVWEHIEPEIVDQCRRRRRDFFLAQRVTFPATLPAGSYVLKVMVEDLLSGRTDEAIEPFVISSALSLAGHFGK